MKPGKHTFLGEALDIEAERKRIKTENDRIPWDDPDLEDFFGYDLKADEACFDAESRQIYKKRIKTAVLNVLIDADENDTGPIQTDEIRKRLNLSADISDAEILEALENLQNEDRVWHVPNGKGWVLTPHGVGWAKLTAETT